MGDRGHGRGREPATRPKEPRGRGRTAAKSNDDPGRAKTQVAGRAPGQNSPKKEPVQRGDPGERTAVRANTTGRKGKDQPDHRQGRQDQPNPRQARQDQPDPRQARQDQPVHRRNSLKPVYERLKLKMKDISNAADKVNGIVKVIIDKLSDREPLFKGMERMSTGSYYEGMKISRPNEFDIMLKIPISDHQRIGLTEFGGSGAFYTLSCKRSVVDYGMNKYVDDHGNISAIKILTQLRKLVNEAVSGRPVSIKRRNPSSPALTLIIENKPTNIDVDLVIALEIRQSWPANTKDGMNIDSWLGRKVKRDFKFFPFYMVPKKCNDGNTTNDTWRISFSHIEKEILTNHGSSKTCCEADGEKCCRKQCLKLLKHLLELLKNNGKQRRKLDKFCSYYAKTALLHHCAQYPKDEDWKLEDLDVCFNRYVQFFQLCLKKACLPNFFIPSHNLFNLESVDCNLLYDQIDDQIKHNYPLFHL
ncbi:PREDICTED: cyclic GMP-AMP synthase-like [Nanorana parkeri]|uniref:cyclic GMP-AMP synthase-like n=1 Tax=Nanorana parkeri TaxID=125878 RepID=UPI00085425F0|nr:PREDICTED: cyclic GMP-AMP synthase-like [Nanorana parkeri]